MKEKNNNENGEELIDLDEEGNPLKEKEIQTPDKSFYYIIILTPIILIIIILIIYITNKSHITYLKFKTIDDINRKISETIINFVLNNQNANIGLIMREELVDIYNNIIHEYEKGKVSFKNVKFFSFDGFCGLDKKNKNSYNYKLINTFLSKIDYQEKNLFLINEGGRYIKEYENIIEEYEQLLIHNPIDLQIITFEENGNIGYNGPDTNFDSLINIIQIPPEKRQMIKNEFGGLDNTPLHIITQGIGSILQAKEVIVIGYGKERSNALKILKNNIFTKKSPVTALVKHWGKVTVYIDE